MEADRGPGADTLVRSLTIDAVGEPGERIFYFQYEDASGQICSLLLEKTQALMLADQVDDLFAQFPELSTTAGNLPDYRPPRFEEPSSVMFRAGQFALKYQAKADLIGLDVSELRGIDQGTPAHIQLFVSPRQLRTLADHARDVARRGIAYSS